MSLVEIEDFDALIYNKPFFDQPVKIKQEAYEKPRWNVKKRLLHNRKLIKFFILWKIIINSLV